MNGIKQVSGASRSTSRARSSNSAEVFARVPKTTFGPPCATFGVRGVRMRESMSANFHSAPACFGEIALQWIERRRRRGAAGLSRALSSARTLPPRPTYSGRSPGEHEGSVATAAQRRSGARAADHGHEVQRVVVQDRRALVSWDPRSLNGGGASGLIDPVTTTCALTLASTSRRSGWIGLLIMRLRMPWIFCAAPTRRRTFTGTRPPVTGSCR